MLSKKFKPMSEGSLMLTSPRPALNSLSRCKFLDLGQKIILSSAYVCHCHMLGRPAFIKHKVLLVSRGFFGDVLDGPKWNPEEPQTSQGLIIFLQDQEKFVTMKWLSYFLRCHQVSSQSGLFLPPHIIVERAKKPLLWQKLRLKVHIMWWFQLNINCIQRPALRNSNYDIRKVTSDQKVTEQWTALAFFRTTWLELDLYSCEIK